VIAGEWELLTEETEEAARNAYAEGTRRNLVIQWDTYLEFCEYFRIKQIVPATSEVLSNYITYLARGMKSPDTIQNYISGVKSIHTLMGEKTEQFDDMKAKLVLKGVAKQLKHTKKRAEPITPGLLLEMREVVNWEEEVEVASWSAALLAFFTMMRKSNLVAESAKHVDKNKQLLRGDIKLGEETLMVYSKWSKTNQDGKRSVALPVAAHSRTEICPVEAYRGMTTKIPGKADGPAFIWRKHGKVKPLSYRKWQSTFRGWLSQIGQDPHLFSSHSFRRGGATWAFKVQVPGEMIQKMGDWRSDCYKQYLDMPTEVRAEAAIRMARSVGGERS